MDGCVPSIVQWLPNLVIANENISILQNSRPTLQRLLQIAGSNASRQASKRETSPYDWPPWPQSAVCQHGGLYRHRLIERSHAALEGSHGK